MNWFMLIVLAVLVGLLLLGPGRRLLLGRWDPFGSRQPRAPRPLFQRVDGVSSAFRRGAFGEFGGARRIEELYLRR
jgi:hypothetical protein